MRRLYCRARSVKIALGTETFPPAINGVAMTFGVVVREPGRRGPAVTARRPRREDLPAGEAAGALQSWETVVGRCEADLIARAARGARRAAPVFA